MFQKTSQWPPAAWGPTESVGSEALWQYGDSYLLMLHSTHCFINSYSNVNRLKSSCNDQPVLTSQSVSQVYNLPLVIISLESLMKVEPSLAIHALKPVPDIHSIVQHRKYYFSHTEIIFNIFYNKWNWYILSASYLWWKICCICDWNMLIWTVEYTL